MLSLTKKVKCPQCNEEIVISGDTLAKAVERAKKIGLFSLAFRHKDHVVLIYIDEKGGIRGVETAPLVKVEKPVFLKFDIIPVPKPKEKMPSLNKLSNEELAVLTWCDGQTTLSEIAEALSMPYDLVKAIVESLYGAGYLKELKEVVTK